MGKVNRLNDKHYMDTTAHDAMEKVLREVAEIDKKCGVLISVLRNMIELSGFELTNRMELKHKASGREYK